MKVVSWNVNSVKARQDRVLRFLRAREPDVLCLQELKVVEEAFPWDEIEALGYRAAVFGQKTYNGVAIISKAPLEDVTTGFVDGVDDPQARFIAATVDGIRIASVYVPNGQSLTSDKYPYKKEWLRRLRAYLDSHHEPSDPLLLCGDFNIVPADLDVLHPDQWQDTVLLNPEVRSLLESLLDWGLVDTFRLHNDEPHQFSWWDYRRAAFDRNDGMRIDLILATAPLVERCVTSFIDRDERVEVPGDKPSDHVPIMLSLDWTFQVQGTLAL